MARLDQCKPRLDQVTTSAGLAVAGYGDGSTGAGWGRQWELWTRLNQGSTDGSAGLKLHARGWWLGRTLQWRRRTGAGQNRVRQGAVVLVQGANRGGSVGAHGWPGPSPPPPPPPPPPLPLNKALRKPKSLWASFAIIAKSELHLQKIIIFI